MYLSQGVDHALQGNASQGIGENRGVKQIPVELGSGDISRFESDLGPQVFWCGSSRRLDFRLIDIDSEYRGRLPGEAPGHAALTAAHFQDPQAVEVNQTIDDSGFDSLRIDREAQVHLQW